MELGDAQALLVHMDIQDLPVLLAHRDLRVFAVHLDQSEEEALQDLLDLQATEVNVVKVLVLVDGCCLIVCYHIYNRNQPLRSAP